MSLEEPTCPVLGLLGTDHAVPGPACGHKSLESASLPGRELWEAPLPPAPPTTSSSGPLLRVAQPLAPSLQLPVSWAPHSRPGWLAAFQGGVQLPGIRGMGLGRLEGQASWRCFGFDSGLDCSWRLDCLDLTGSLPWLLPRWTHCFHRPRVSLRWERAALGRLNASGLSCYCSIPDLVLPLRVPGSPPGFSVISLPAPQGPPEPVLHGPGHLTSQIKPSKATPFALGSLSASLGDGALLFLSVIPLVVCRLSLPQFPGLPVR